MRKLLFGLSVGLLLTALGCKGDPGAAGADGDDGAPGTTGPAGGAGPAGSNGSAGSDGAAGPAGSTGPAGPAGDAGADGTQGAPGPAGRDAISLTKWDTLPGAKLTILSVAGGTGANGAFRAGDTIAFTFNLKRKDGSNLPIGELSSAATYVSGPTSNYQRVIASQGDVVARSSEVSAGVYRYAFAAPIPATYLAPLNDSPAFDAGHGELAGQPLLGGTYTVGLQVYKSYRIEGVTYRDTGNATADFLFGNATTLTKREVVTQANCDQCHSRLQAHGGSRNQLGNCLLCHTAGAEDRNVSTVLNGTPGVTIEFGPMVHRIHNAAHLPSVLGVGTNTDGSRNYASTPVPYRIVGYNDSINDFSEAAFPVMPSAYVAYLYDAAGTTYRGTGGNGPMPRDIGWSVLSATSKLKEDKIRAGAVACEKCHGDPDGAGALPAPSQGSQHESVATRRACGSCHDDIDWSRPYASNGLTMPPQTNDATCSVCHPASGTGQSVRGAHLHPYSNPVSNTGVNLNLSAVGGGTGPSGRHQTGDTFQLTFSVKNNAGADLPIVKLTRLQAIVVGPTTNPQIILPNLNVYDFAFRKASQFSGNGTITAPAVAAGATAQVIAVVFTSATTFDVVGSVSAAVTAQTVGTAVTYAGVTFTVTAGTTAFAINDRYYFEVVPPAATYALTMPADFSFERVGAATGGADVLNVANLPLYWGRQVVFERTVTGVASTLGASAIFQQRHVVADLSTLAGLVVGDRVVLDDGTASEEYLQVGHVQTTSDQDGADLGASDRLHFTTVTRYPHSAGASIKKVTLSSRREGTDYTVSDAATGELTLIAGRFTAGNPVVVSYRTHGRFGWKRAPGDGVQAVFPAPVADSEEIGASAGDWKSLPLMDGTYTVGMWSNVDFTVTPAGAVTNTTAWNDFATDNTTYRMMAPPATKGLLFGAATTLQPRAVIESGATCNSCHGDLAAHGFGRRGLDTCLLCHSASGLEDGPKFSFSSWYVRPTPGVAMEFRSLAHRLHAGKELSRPFEVNGVFLGVPYPVSYEAVGFPVLPNGVSDCTKCHGATNTAWQEPAVRSNPLAPVPVQTWAATCSSCHDSTDAAAHFRLQSFFGEESCGVCHGKGREFSVEVSHKLH